MSRFLERWSRLKRVEADVAASVAPPVAAPPVAAPAGLQEHPAETALPPIDSLDLKADFTAFMKQEVSESLRRAALRKLFSDPHFHFERMDKLDIYIDDYSGKDPIPPDMLQKLRQFETLLKDEEAPAATPDAVGGEAQTAAADVAPPPAEGPPSASDTQTAAADRGDEAGKTT